MSAAESLASLPPDKLRRWGQAGLIAALVFFLLLTLVLAASGIEWAALIPPAALILVAGGVWLFRRPAFNLVAVIVGFVVIANNESGFQVREILYAIYLYSVLALWYAHRLFITKESFLQLRTDHSLWLFLILLPMTLPLTVIFNGSLNGAVSELFSLSLLALYFPLKETAARYQWGTRGLVITVIAVGALVSIRNLYEYGLMLGRVTQTWQVETGRVVTNDNLLMVSSLFCLALLVYVKNKKTFLLGAAGFVLTFGGLILTQSRGYWVAFLVGAVVLFILSDNKHRGYMLVWGGAGLAFLTAAGFLLAGPFMSILVEGLASRLVSIGSASTADLSLVNRFGEAATVMEYIRANPILGYGMGVSYYYYDIAHQSTHFDALVHNGYVGLWYKFGLWGLGLLLFFWATTLVHGLKAFLRKESSYWTKICGLSAAMSLVGFSLSTLTSNPFFLKDSLFIFSVTVGLGGGAYLRSQIEVASAKAG